MRSFSGVGAFGAVAFGTVAKVRHKFGTTVKDASSVTATAVAMARRIRRVTAELAAITIGTARVARAVLPVWASFVKTGLAASSKKRRQLAQAELAAFRNPVLNRRKKPRQLAIF